MGEPVLILDLGTIKTGGNPKAQVMCFWSGKKRGCLPSLSFPKKFNLHSVKVNFKKVVKSLWILKIQCLIWHKTRGYSNKQTLIYIFFFNPRHTVSWKIYGTLLHSLLPQTCCTLYYYSGTWTLESSITRDGTQFF